MYAYQNNTLSIPAKLLYEAWQIVSYNYYKQMCYRGVIIRTKEGRGKGNQAWVSFHDLPMYIKDYCILKLGNPKDKIIVNHLEKYIVPDVEAVKFYAQHRKPNGKPLHFDKQREKATNVMILNAVHTILTDPVITKKAFGAKKSKVWQNITDAVNHLATIQNGNVPKWEFTLPGNPRSLERRYKKYLKLKYGAFIHAGEGSKNAQKVTQDLESLIISLYCLPNKPYVSWVCDMYLDFLKGELTIANIETGEVYEPSDFEKNGKPIEISEDTVWNYLKKPRNKLIINKYRNGTYDFNHKDRPHANRTRAQFSMSKISLDDRDLMHTKLADGTKVMTYYAFDTMSTAMIGISHSIKKDNDLFADCIKNMFRFTSNLGMGTPLQLEVEHHLVNNFKDGLMKAGNMFPFVRWCNPTNSQEKRAERFIGAKKYGVEKRNNQNVGRHYSKLDSNRITRQKIFDEDNDNYKFAKGSYEDIVAQDLAEQIEYNNELHPDQDNFEGLTRLDVFKQNVNPNLPDFDKAMLAKFIGEHTPTTIRRSQYATVQYEKWQLPSPQVLEALKPNNYKVDAYYIPNPDGTIDEIYMYQDDSFICACKPVPKFNEANAEWTDADVEGYHQATKYTGAFDGMVKKDTQEKLQRVTVINNKIKPKVVEPVVIDIPEEPELPDIDYSYTEADRLETERKALEDF